MSEIYIDHKDGLFEVVYFDHLFSGQLRMESSWGGRRLGLLWGWVVGLRWVVWIRFWVPRWIQGLSQVLAGGNGSRQISLRP